MIHPKVVDIELSEYDVSWKDQRPSSISVEGLHEFCQGEFFSDRFWEFLGKLPELLNIQVAEFKLIAKGDLTS